MKTTSMFLTFSVVMYMTSCSKAPTFEEQIVNDISVHMPTGICDSIPSGSIISNIVVGEIVPIEGLGIDVSMEFDHEKNGIKKHLTGAMLYSKKGNIYTLEAIGGCEYGEN